VAVTTVDEYIAETSGPVGETLQAARRLILDTLPDVEEFMKWGTPAYRLPHGGPICYLYGGEDHVNLGFLFGARLDDPDDLLQGAGKKDSRHVHLDSPESVDNDLIARLLTDSVGLAS
jgi:hypothetical protein